MKLLIYCITHLVSRIGDSISDVLPLLASTFVTYGNGTKIFPFCLSVTTSCWLFVPNGNGSVALGNSMMLS